MKICTHNVLHGTIAAIHTDVTTSHVEIAIGETILVASMTNESLKALNLAVGMSADAVINPSDVLIMVE